MKISELTYNIRKKKSFLCIGLDVDLDKIPTQLLGLEDPIFAFNKAIIDATHSYCVAYKPNTAFYEAYGEKGWKSLKKTFQYLNDNYPDHFTVADAKRGDIGNTSTRYARAFYEDLNADSVTIAPYMGRDSVEPFLAGAGSGRDHCGPGQCVGCGIRGSVSRIYPWLGSADRGSRVHFDPRGGNRFTSSHYGCIGGSDS